MKIVKVTSCGVDRLINAYKSTMIENSEYKFGSKSDEFFENVEISLLLSDVKGIELIALKKFCPSLIVLDIKGETFSKEPKPITNAVLRKIGEKDDSDIKRKSELDKLSEQIVSLSKYISVLLKTDKLDKSFYGMFDIGSFRFNVIARFKGVNIMALLDAFPEFLLYKRQKRTFIEPNTKEFDNLCGQQFIKNFFSYMENMLSACDVLTDVRFNEEYYKYLSDSTSCICTHIRNPIMEIKMNNYNSVSELINDIKFINVESGFISYDINLSSDLIYHFAVSASIETLLVLLSYTNVVYNYSDLKTILGVKTITSNINFSFPENTSNSVKKDVNVVFNDAIEYIDNWRLNTLKELSSEEKSDSKNKVIHYSRLELYNFIPRSAKLNFMIYGTEEELKSMISLLKNKKELAINSEIISIINTIENQFNLIRVAWNSI